MQAWWQIEGAPGLFLRLKDRPDLLLKVEARLQALYQRRLRLEWTQSGLRIAFAPTMGGAPYFANVEASGLLELVPLLAALYDDEIAALLIDEAEISLHPQLQAFLLQEIEAVGGGPFNPTKKLVFIATHSPSMLPLRRIGDVPRLVLFSERQTQPVQISTSAGELQSRKLAALVARLSENHKLAFFARSVLLVEGPSDEIVVSALSLKLEHPLLGSNTQVVPVTGKGQIAETVKLFRLMGKRVFVLADLDALIDDNQLVSAFGEAARTAANDAGMGTVYGDRSRYSRQSRNTTRSSLQSPSARGRNTQILDCARPFPCGRVEGQTARNGCCPTYIRRGRPCSKQYRHGAEGSAKALRSARGIMAKAGCTFLRRGTIEDYYFRQFPATSYTKPEASAAEAELFASRNDSEIRQQYADVIQAMEIAAPIKKIDENDLLREQLGSLLGAAMQIVRPGMLDDELNVRATANFSSTKPIFQFSNKSREEGANNTVRRVEVSITSPLFVRGGFPFEVTDRDNLTALIEQKLPPAS